MILENFNRSNRALDTGPSGVAPEALSGTPTIAANALSFAEAATTNPLVVWDLTTGEVRAALDVGLGDALYFRVVDATNWWRARLRTTTRTRSTIVTVYDCQFYPGAGAQVPRFHDHFFEGQSQPCPPSISHAHYHNGEFQETHTHGLNTVTVFTRARTVTAQTSYVSHQVVIEKSVAGVVSEVDSYDLSTAKPTRLSVLAKGSKITTWTNLSSTALGILTDGTHATATKHGAGKGGPTDAAASAIDNLELLEQLTAPSAPILVEPANGAFVDATKPIVVRYRFQDPDPGDTQGAQAIRVAVDGGAASYLDAAGTALSGTQVKRTTTLEEATLPADLFTNGHTVDWSALTWDQTDRVGPYATAFTFTTMADPVVTILEPDTGDVLDSPSFDVVYAYDGPGDREAHRAFAVARELADADDFDPGLAPLLADSGWVSVAPTAENRIRLNGLPLAADLAVFVEARQVGGQVSARARVDPSILVRPLATPFATLVVNDARKAVVLNVEPADSLMTETQWNLEDDVDGWEPGETVTLAHSTSVAKEGAGAAKVTAAAAGDGEIHTLAGMDGFLVRSGRSATGMVYVRDGGRPVRARLVARRYDLAGGFHDESVGPWVDPADPPDEEEPPGEEEPTPTFDPVAVPGPTDPTITLGDVLQLDGSGSYDPEGVAIASYDWTTVAGPSVLTFSSSSIAAPTLEPTVAGSYDLGLRVTTTDGRVSARAILRLTVQPVVQPGDAPRQIGVFWGDIGNHPELADAFADDLLGGETIRLLEIFHGGGTGWPGIIAPVAQHQRLQTWMSGASGRRVVYSISMVPQHGPTQSWSLRQGTDAQVATALNQGANGDYDHHFVDLGERLVAYGSEDAILRIGWEFNGAWYWHRAAPDVDAWIAYFRRIVNALRSVPGQQFKIDWNFAGSKPGIFLGDGSKPRAGSIASAYPGDAYVDFIGDDIYDKHPAANNRTAAERWAEQVSSKEGRLPYLRALGIQRNKPISLPEWGLSDHNTVEPDSLIFVNGMHGFIEANNVAYHIYFNDKASAGDHRISPNGGAHPKAAARFRQLTWRLARGIY